MRSKASSPTGLAFASPTQLNVDPPVCVTIGMLNGTMRKPLMFPMMVAGRRSSTNSVARLFALTSSPPQAGDPTTAVPSIALM